MTTGMPHIVRTSTTISALSLALALPGLGCDGPEARRASTTAAWTNLAPTTTTPPTGTTPTGTQPTVVPECTPSAVAQDVVLTGDEVGDWAGRFIEVADVDGDGCDEVVASASWDGGDLYGPSVVHSGVYLLAQPAAGGLLADVATVVWEGSGLDGGMDFWGHPLGVLPSQGQVAIVGIGEDADHLVHLMSARPVVPGTLSPGDAVATLWTPGSYRQLGIASDVGECRAPSGLPALCVGTIQSSHVENDWAGQVLVFEPPLTGEFELDDAVARYFGDDGDNVRTFDAATDLDGDGLADQVLGSLSRNGTGAVAVVANPPPGDARIWDIADATLLGEEVASEFGLAVRAGDLDGDGHPDLMVSAPLGSGESYVFAGPDFGAEPSDATWTVLGSRTTSGWATTGRSRT